MLVVHYYKQKVLTSSSTVNENQEERWQVYIYIKKMYMIWFVLNLYSLKMFLYWGKLTACTVKYQIYYTTMPSDGRTGSDYVEHKSNKF